MRKVCMVVQDPLVKGGIAAVVNGYRGSELERNFQIIYVESYKDGGKATKMFKGLCGYFHFLKVLIIDKPELVHIHSSFGASFYRKLPFIYLASLAKKPIVNHIHGADFDLFYNNATKAKRNLIKRVYNKCDVLIALSNEWKDRLDKIVPPTKITVLENYSTINDNAYKERLGRDGNNTVLFLGELGKRKGCYDIPSVIRKVASCVPNVKFILCGAGSREDEKSIRKLIKENLVEGNTEFPGWVREDRKDDVLRRADLFFLPSYNEGMPMSILDAMGYGLPIVSTNVGGIPKIVHDDENGKCCNPGDVETMAAAIIELLTNESKRKEASANSMRIVREGYSLDAHLSKLKNIYERLL